ncbi:MAG: hypothetical protein IPP49_07150 [Saprospiraceae bacterium]|nr:hypothetical protein [Saprospiraceae bacterium]
MYQSGNTKFRDWEVTDQCGIKLLERAFVVKEEYQQCMATDHDLTKYRVHSDLGVVEY